MTGPWIRNAQQVSAGQTDDEPLAEQVHDPLWHLTQVQIKDFYTPAEYGTNAQPKSEQLRAIFALRPFSFIPVEHLVRPTFKVVTVPNGKGASTTTAYDDMQSLDLLTMPWRNSEETQSDRAIHRELPGRPVNSEAGIVNSPRPASDFLFAPTSPQVVSCLTAAASSAMPDRG